MSVLIPAYNVGQYIGAAIESVLEQSHKAREIVVVDDGSTDDTVAVAQKYPVEIVRQENQGSPGAARNGGLAYCKGEYIAFLDADDLMLRDRLERQVAQLESDSTIGLSFSDYQNFSAESGPQAAHFTQCNRLRSLMRDHDTIVLRAPLGSRLIVAENFGSTTSMTIRREVLRTVPGFQSDLLVGEDMYFTFLAARRWGVGFVNHIGTLRRLHGRNISGEPLRYIEHGIVANRLMRAIERDAATSRVLDQALARAELSLSRELANRGEVKRALHASWRSMFLSPSLASCRVGLRALAIAAGLMRV